MKKINLKLDKLVNSEIDAAKQKAIRGGQEEEAKDCYCVTVTTPEGKGSTRNEAKNKPK